jgi:hypothetical protein
MRSEKTISLLRNYVESFCQDVVPERQSLTQRGTMQHKQLAHLAWMLGELERKLKDQEIKPGQLDRWLGFAQGMLWSLGLKDIDSLRNDNLS